LEIRLRDGVVSRAELRTEILRRFKRERWTGCLTLLAAVVGAAAAIIAAIEARRPLALSSSIFAAPAPDCGETRICVFQGAVSRRNPPDSLERLLHGEVVEDRLLAG
jgi:hypothetical protein